MQAPKQVLIESVFANPEVDEGTGRFRFCEKLVGLEGPDDPSRKGRRGCLERLGRGKAADCEIAHFGLRGLTDDKESFVLAKGASDDFPSTGRKDIQGRCHGAAIYLALPRAA